MENGAIALGNTLRGMVERHSWTGIEVVATPQSRARPGFQSPDAPPGAGPLAARALSHYEGYPNEGSKITVGECKTQLSECKHLARHNGCSALRRNVWIVVLPDELLNGKPRVFPRMQQREIGNAV